jgi:hypothetical protein
MKKISRTKKDEIINNICDFNLEKLIYNLDELKIFSKEKGRIKELKNNNEFMTNNSLLYKNGGNSYNRIKDELSQIVNELNK